MKIGIIGGGIVGYATSVAFKDHEVYVYDILPERSSEPQPIITKALSADLVFVCLPTPQLENCLECDTSILDDFFYSVSKEGTYREANLVLRSTVPVGYTRLTRQNFGLTNLVHSPEFLTARTAVEDACNPKRMVIGCPEQPWLDYEGCGRKLGDMYRERWPSLFVKYMTSDESEALKLFQNSFSAVKVAWFNEARAFADKLGLDWQRVLEALLAGGWINPAHTQVPGPDGKRGFGGTCLPKDIASLISQIEDEKLDASVCRAAWKRNLEDRKR